MSITYLLIGFTVLISFWAFNNREVIIKFSHRPIEEANDKEYYRMLTAGFLHGDHMHLLFNMITLYFFGLGVEQWFAYTFDGLGNLIFLFFYLIAIVAASLGTYYRHKNDPRFASIGASGAVSAVLFAAILINPSLSLYIMFIPIPIPGFIYGIFYLWYSSRAAQTGGDNIDHLAHFYGAVFGLLFPLVLKPQLLPDFFAQLSIWFSSLGS